MRARNTMDHPELNAPPVFPASLDDIPQKTTFTVFNNTTGECAGNITREHLCCLLRYHLKNHAEIDGEPQTLNDIYMLEEEVELLAETCPDDELLSVLRAATAPQHDAVLRWTA